LEEGRHRAKLYRQGILLSDTVAGIGTFCYNYLVRFHSISGRDGLFSSTARPFWILADQGILVAVPHKMRHLAAGSSNPIKAFCSSVWGEANVTVYQAEARCFFPPSSNVAYSSTDSDSAYTYQSSASVDTLSLDPTVATTVTSTTMSLAASSASVIQHLEYDSDDESFTSVMTSDSVFPYDQDTNTMFSATPTASANAELSLATLSTSTINHSTFTSQEEEESTTVASGGTDHSSQISSADSSLSWANF
jgi:hypothetical protein